MESTQQLLMDRACLPLSLIYDLISRSGARLMGGDHRHSLAVSLPGPNTIFLPCPNFKAFKLSNNNCGSGLLADPRGPDWREHPPGEPLPFHHNYLNHQL